MSDYREAGQPRKDPPLFLAAVDQYRNLWRQFISGTGYAAGLQGMLTIGERVFDAAGASGFANATSDVFFFPAILEASLFNLMADEQNRRGKRGKALLLGQGTAFWMAVGGAEAAHAWSKGNLFWTGIGAAAGFTLGEGVTLYQFAPRLARRSQTIQHV